MFFRVTKRNISADDRTLSLSLALCETVVHVVAKRMTKDRVWYLVGPTLHAYTFELGAIAAYLVREAFLLFLLASCFFLCNTSHVYSLVKLTYPTNRRTCIFVCGLFLGMVIKPHQNHGIYSRCRLTRERVFWHVDHVVSQECQCKTFLCAKKTSRNSVAVLCAPCVSGKK